MKPVLIVEGKQLEVISISLNKEGKPYWVLVRTDNGSQAYHDFSHNAEPFMESIAIDMEKAFSDGTNEDMRDKIQARIEAIEEKMIELAMEYIQHEGPFAEKGELQKEFYRLERQVNGLWQAIEIVEGKHEEGILERFARGVVESAVILSKGKAGLAEGKSFEKLHT
ncbi:MAG: hypothetical protein ABS960_00480 [Solibacillus isronensis]